jgi:hypothetical protein
MEHLQTNILLLSVQFVLGAFAIYQGVTLQWSLSLTVAVIACLCLLQGARPRNVQLIIGGGAVAFEQFNGDAAGDDDEEQDEEGEEDVDAVAGKSSRRRVTDAHLIDSEGNYHPSLSDAFAKLHRTIHELQAPLRKQQKQSMRP